MDLSLPIAGTLLPRSSHGKVKHRSAGRIGLHRDPSTVCLDNGAADRQANTHAMTLISDKWLEELRSQFRWDARARISYADGDHIVVGGRRGNDKLASWRGRHCLDGISQQVEQHLLNLHPVDQDEIDAGLELKSYLKILIFRSDQRQGAGLFDEFFDALHPALAIAARHEIAQATNDLARAQSLVTSFVHSIAEQTQAVLGTTLEQALRTLHVCDDGQ